MGFEYHCQRCGGKLIQLCSLEAVSKFGFDKVMALRETLRASRDTFTGALVCEDCKALYSGRWEPKGGGVYELAYDFEPFHLTESLKDEDLERILWTAYKKARKYRDGVKTKDTWLLESLIEIVLHQKIALEENGVLFTPFDFHQRRIIAFRLLEWSYEKGLFEKVKNVDMAVPYAYRKHYWKGIKAHITWSVIKPK